jgi:hypothetical protein
VQAPRDGELERRLRLRPPASVSGGEVVVEALPVDAAGRLDASDVGDVVMSLLSPEALLRDRDEVRNALDGAGTGDEPLVVVVEAAEELRDDELDALLEAARRSPRVVILRIQADATRR